MFEAPEQTGHEDVLTTAVHHLYEVVTLTPSRSTGRRRIGPKTSTRAKAILMLHKALGPFARGLLGAQLSYHWHHATPRKVGAAGRKWGAGGRARTAVVSSHVVIVDARARRR